MDITAIVVTYNRKELLQECLKAILEQQHSVDRIILIDNNSTDNTYETLQKNSFIENEKIIYKKLDKNIGGAGGFYEGFKLAQNYNTDYLWIMDDDTIPTKSCLKELIDAVNVLQDEKVSYLASSIYGANNEVMNVPSVNIEPSENGYADWYRYLDKGIIKIKEATFVSLLINNNAVKKIGFPVKDYFIWGDDTEYTLRLNKYYGNSYMVGKSVAIHKRKIAKSLSIYEEDNDTRINFYYYKYRNNLLNYKEYKGKNKAIKYFFTIFKNSIKAVFKPGCKKKMKKFIVMNKALFAFLFRKYDYEAFKNRFDLNVKYRN